MFALSVSVNDEPLCTAGAPVDGVIGVNLCWVDVSRWSLGHLSFWVGGLDSSTQEHLCWQAPCLEVGDRVSVKLVEADAVDPPLERESKQDNHRFWLWRHYQRRAREELSMLRANPRVWVAELGNTVERAIREAVTPHCPLGFRVTHDGHEVCTAGVPPPCVLTAGVTAAQPRGEPAARRLSLEVGALDSRRGEHVHWNTPRLRGDDMVTIEVLATERWDAPSGRRRAK